ncbi:MULTISPECIES: MerR family transcriptional regulator [Stutzerimonas]|jgi:DNA-binding transcriptional MerR regulator|uniref:MerR family transcriptional regulator n=1 Tax=Stutzerimonas TaxID=2901164 RepID=UPI0007B808F0|nr:MULTISPECIES: helix-turn-helix domain-containing protein [Stutzerimonas]HCI3982904.1 helix-turn-helix domain-containing protein [Pseudomonas aeruginosa]KZX54681.1 hypothetical protein A3710_06180 [Stutzerimonas frequens]MBK3874671.1 MerR family DNA-binding protein [Stutzerimonas frequens]MBK3912940.1 MerR family DNA-binding protein [Stutzerimonas frequens]MBK3932186.1 MerR family DNA-binding protein [Stutzerimonas frequens]
MRQQCYRIGELAKRTGVGVPTIRYYGEVGLLPEAGRGPGGQRLYESSHLRRLMFIRHCRKLGFSQEDVRALLSHANQTNASCKQVDRLARRHLKNVREKIAALQALEQALEDMIDGCQGGSVEECQIVGALTVGE